MKTPQAKLDAVAKRWREDADFREQRKAYVKDWRRRNRDKIAGYSRTARKKLRAAYREFLIRVKKKCGCMNPTCRWQGEVPVYALDFHHVSRKSKKFSIGSSCRPLSTAAREMKKCVVLCSICHRMATWGDLDLAGVKTCDVAAK